MSVHFRLLLLLFLLTACADEDEDLEIFTLEDQFIEVTLSDGRRYRMQSILHPYNTSIFYYSGDDRNANVFINRKTDDGSISGALNFNFIIPDAYFDDFGDFYPDRLDYPFQVGRSTVSLSVPGKEVELDTYDFRNIDVYLDAWEDGIASGRFLQTYPTAIGDTVTLEEGAFRVALQVIKL